MRLLKSRGEAEERAMPNTRKLRKGGNSKRSALVRVALTYSTSTTHAKAALGMSIVTVLVASTKVGFGRNVSLFLLLPRRGLHFHRANCTSPSRLLHNYASPRLFALSSVLICAAQMIRGSLEASLCSLSSVALHLRLRLLLLWNKYMVHSV